jgi:2-C-methyl-D-erythritol 4-phosphate cytidylyltransferase/2-C-methyl-D-erythritol 2,4-cyclodiphosphate synthase
LSDPHDFTGIVVAGGRGTRFGGAVPKQFSRLGTLTLLERSMAALAGRPAVRGVVLVLPEAEVRSERGRDLRSRPGVLDVVAGGDTRADSVRHGLLASGESRFVLVHDAARPLVSAALVDAVVSATRRVGAAIPGIPVPDTVKRINGDGLVTDTIAREPLRLAQTPQGARRDWLVRALERAAAEGAEITDEAAALERAGHPVEVVPGDPDNRKITGPEDLERARRQLEILPELRVGTGFDIHAVDAARRLVLAGVEFPEGPGLSGHSDADVVLHAAMDALLGAAGLGDIGVHFPPEDDRFAGAASTGLAAEVAWMLEREGWSIVNLDLTRVGLKATTLERLGALGRGEGMACEAVALLSRSGPPVEEPTRVS